MVDFARGEGYASLAKGEVIGVLIAGLIPPVLFRAEAMPWPTWFSLIHSSEVRF